MPASTSHRRRGRPPGSRTRLPASLDTVLTVRLDQAVAMSGIGRSKLKQLIADGSLASTKVGSMRLVSVASLRRLVEPASDQE